MLRTDLIAPIAVLMQRHAHTRGGKSAYQDGTRSVTYADLLRRTGKLAGHLADLTIAVGESVAILLPNSVDWVEACLATTRAGAICVPISYDSSEPEILYRLNDAACRAIVTTDEKCELVARLRAQVPSLSVVVLTDCGSKQDDGLRFSDLAKSTPKSAPRDPTNIDAPAYVVYTSGTTGRAKGVVLTVRGMLWVTAACWAPICGLSEKDVVLSPLPLFHSYALNLSVLSIFAAGASARLMEKFSPQQALELMQSGQYTVFPGVPTMFHYLLHRAQESGIGQLGNIRLCISAGAIMPAT